eukprot:TRINITY_DN6078_c0_g1_i2.p1 TRINITY_DN6078_c0_g1~~TRINITY_DN6078_c0_g1_i2.p1  ORF type:complete len:223 (-),score=44.11 TRINITY_DN6078_c0_g1_i2:115-783(-)
MKLSDIKKLPLNYWLINLAFVTSSSSLLLNVFGVLYIVDTMAYSEQISALVMSLSNLATIIGPLFSYFILKSKWSFEIWIASFFIAAVSYGFMAWNVGHAVVSLIVCTLGYAATGPSLIAYVPNIVPPELTGSGMGFILSLLDIIFIIIPTSMGVTQEKTGNWIGSMLILGSLQLVGMICVIVVRFRLRGSKQKQDDYSDSDSIVVSGSLESTSSSEDITVE